MAVVAGIEARLAWAILFGESATGLLEEPATSYGTAEELDLLSARELLALLGRIRTLLAAKGYDISDRGDSPSQMQGPATLLIDRDYRVFVTFPEEAVPGSKELALQPILKTVFILFLKHPEGISLKDRAAYQAELDAIYTRICPNLDPDARARRIARLVSPLDNSFSEKLSNLNKHLENFLSRHLPPTEAAHYQIRGQRGLPRRIALDPLFVRWE